MPSFDQRIASVPDFPQPGVLFRDVSPMLADPASFAQCIEALAAPWREQNVQAVCGIESRGFIFGAALAMAVGAGFVPIRKPRKLPPPVLGIDYQLEYGSDRLEVGARALHAGERVLLVDDVLATGGTLAAARALLLQLDVTLLGAAVVIELDALGGRARWQGDVPLQALLHY
jgi:adenine phosphoribosyltransferase